MTQAKQGDTVQVNYTGKLPDGTVFDTSYGRHPLQVTLGQGRLIAGFEKAVLGMNTGDKKTVVIPPSEAYGPRQEGAIAEVPRKNLPQGLDVRVGQRLELTQQNDETVLVTVIGASESSLTLDANHPLAGRDLTFDIELVSIVG